MFCYIDNYLYVSAVHGVNIRIPPPTRYVTPYGGRLEWRLPGNNKIVAHLKDKVVIRHRKRWSQVTSKRQPQKVALTEYKLECLGPN